MIIVNETESIDLECESHNSLPMLNFTWFNENANEYERFSLTDEIRNVFKNTLRITDIDESDNGSFECYHENEIGSDKMIIELLVQTKPKIDSITVNLNDEVTEIESETSVLEHDEVTFDCVVDGFPTPDVTWFKDREQLDVGNGTSLKLERTLEYHAGQYECSARNILGDASKSFHLQVNVPPKIVTLHENMMKVTEGENVTLPCDVTGSPEPKIFWFMNDDNHMNDRFEISDDKKALTFVGHLIDSGIYSCLGVNDFGSVYINYTVLVLGKRWNVSEDS